MIMKIGSIEVSTKELNLIDENIKRIKEKTIPAICDFIETNCKVIGYEDAKVLPDTIRELRMLVEIFKEEKENFDLEDEEIMTDIGDEIKKQSEVI